MKPEQLFWQLVKQHLPAAFCERVENVAGSGMPDVHALDVAWEYWVELKVVPDNREWSPLSLLRPAQRAWHASASKAGAYVFILVRQGNLVVLFSSKGTAATELWRGTRPWDWDDFANTVRGFRWST